MTEQPPVHYEATPLHSEQPRRASRRLPRFTRRPAEQREQPRWLIGAAALAVAVFGVAVHVIAIAESTAGNYGQGTIFAWVAIGLTASAVLAGLAAVILQRGRSGGVAAMALGFVANPLVLVLLYRMLG